MLKHVQLQVESLPSIQCMRMRPHVASQRLREANHKNSPT